MQHFFHGSWLDRRTEGFQVQKSPYIADPARHPVAATRSLLAASTRHLSSQGHPPRVLLQRSLDPDFGEYTPIPPWLERHLVLAS